MPVYIYEALDNRGQAVQGQMEAPSIEAVIEELRSVHYTVTDVKQHSDLASYISESIISMQGVNLYTLAIFTRQFATIFNAGLPLMRGLEGLAKQTSNKKLSRILYQILNDLKGGFSLTRALQKHNKIFTPVYIALIRAAEMAGAMGEILDRLAILLEKEFNLKKKVQTAMTYPAFVFLISMGVTFFLVTYIFPQFVTLIEGLDMKLPWPTVVLIHITNATKNAFVIAMFLILVGVGGYLLKQYFSTPLGRRQIHRLIIESPIVGKILRKLAISRFCRTLGTLLSSGVPMLHSLDVVGKVSGNDVISDIIDEVKMSLKSGERLSTPLQSYPIFPPMVFQMVAVGEETGNLPSMLEKLADFYDLEVENALEAFITLVEPMMILLMGGIVGFVMIAVFMPVYTILQKF